MRVRIAIPDGATPAVTLEASDDLSALDVRVARSISLEEVQAALASIGSGLQGEHAWLDADELRRLALPLAEDPAWRLRFEGMLEYARAQGWLSKDGAAVRAHITRDGL